MIGFFKALVLVVEKDLLLEWRTRARLNALLFFALATLLVFSFAVGPDTKVLQRHAAGYEWLAVLFASVLALAESMAQERDNRAIEGLRLLPLPAEAIFVGKALINAVTLFAIALVLVVAMAALFAVQVALGIPLLLLVCGLGALAIAAPGLLFAAMAAQTRARDVLLPLMLFPLLIPALLALVRASTLVFFGDPMGELGSWLGLLSAFDLVYWGLGAIFFRWVIDE